MKELTEEVGTAEQLLKTRSYPTALPNLLILVAVGFLTSRTDQASLQGSILGLARSLVDDDVASVGTESLSPYPFVMSVCSPASVSV